VILLYNVNITDPLFGLTPLWTGTLAAGAWHSVYPTYTVSGEQWVSNTVTVEGEDNIGGYVTDTDTWLVEILYPAILAIKEANVTNC
jgi:hypothetical protein